MIQRTYLPSNGYVKWLLDRLTDDLGMLSGFPLDFFPVLFAVPRVVGWLAHWRQVRTCCKGRMVEFTYFLDDASRRWREDLETSTSKSFPRGV